MDYYVGIHERLLQLISQHFIVYGFHHLPLSLAWMLRVARLGVRDAAVLF